MSVFKSIAEYFHFELATKYGNRYIRSPEIESFLKSILDSSKDRTIRIPKGKIYYRAQIGKDDPRQIETEEGVSFDTKPRPFPAARMKPIRNRASEGRANPKGIAYL